MAGVSGRWEAELHVRNTCFVGVQNIVCATDPLVSLSMFKYGPILFRT